MVKHRTRKIFVEGGGDGDDSLKTDCRRSFRKLLEKAGLEGRKPRIVACGGRGDAYRQFRFAISAADHEDVMLLLVDAEAPVTEASPWEHVRQREGDGWRKPRNATDDNLHLMVQCMESWFLADRPAMRTFFGQGFQESALPAETADIESVGKTDLYAKLRQATKNTKTKGVYGKGHHSFKLLATLDPALIRKASKWADRVFETMNRLL